MIVTIIILMNQICLMGILKINTQVMLMEIIVLIENNRWLKVHLIRPQDIVWILKHLVYFYKNQIKEGLINHSI